MKKNLFYLFLWLGFILQAQWTQQNSGTTEDLLDVFCISADTALVVGNNGTILRTTNGGINWNPITTTSEHLMKIEFADSQTGYVAGFNGTLLKTTDGGLTWQNLTTNTTENIYALSVVSADTLFVGGDNGLLLKSVDGGNNFQSQNSDTSNKIVDLAFIDADTGYLLIEGNNQNTIFKKTNNACIDWDTTTISNDSPVSIKINNQNELFLLNKWSIYVINNNTLQVLTTDIPFISHCFFVENNTIWVSGEFWDQSIGIMKTEISNPNSNDIWSTNDFIPFANSMDYKNNKRYAVGLRGNILINTNGINTSSISYYNNQYFSIQPNPANDFILISNVTIQNPYYRITDTQGKEIRSLQKLTGQKIDVSDLPAGIYLFHITDLQETYVQKLIIK
jgi:hypothetical protein